MICLRFYVRHTIAVAIRLTKKERQRGSANMFSKNVFKTFFLMINITYARHYQILYYID